VILVEIKAIMLGTSGSSPTKERSMPSVAVVYNGRVLLFDCGEGAQMQMLKYGVNFSKIDAVFISHTHGDHVIGLAGLIRTMAMNKRTSPLDIFVPRGYEKVIHALIAFDKALITYRINVKGIGSGQIYEGKGFHVDSFPLNHTVTCYGYVFAEDDKRRFIVEKCRRLGIRGEQYSVLQQKGSLKVGNRTVKLSQVTTLHYGKRVVYATDTRPANSTLRGARAAQLLIHESSYAESERDLAKERKHSTAMEVAKVAKAAKVKKLVLTHISARYNTSNTLEREARSMFRNTVVAKDGDIIIV